MLIFPQAVADLIIQSVMETAWNRPELALLREPIQEALTGADFRKFTNSSFRQI